jgi:hypothetical protein
MSKYLSSHIWKEEEYDGGQSAKLGIGNDSEDEEEEEEEEVKRPAKRSRSSSSSSSSSAQSSSSHSSAPPSRLHRDAEYSLSPELCDVISLPSASKFEVCDLKIHLEN